MWGRADWPDGPIEALSDVLSYRTLDLPTIFNLSVLSWFFIFPIIAPLLVLLPRTSCKFVEGTRLSRIAGFLVAAMLYAFLGQLSTSPSGTFATFSLPFILLFLVLLSRWAEFSSWELALLWALTPLYPFLNRWYYSGARFPAEEQIALLELTSWSMWLVSAIQLCKSLNLKKDFVRCLTER